MLRTELLIELRTVRFNGTTFFQTWKWGFTFVL